MITRDVAFHIGVTALVALALACGLHFGCTWPWRFSVVAGCLAGAVLFPMRELTHSEWKANRDGVGRFARINWKEWLWPTGLALVAGAAAEIIGD